MLLRFGDKKKLTLTQFLSSVLLAPQFSKRENTKSKQNNIFATNNSRKNLLHNLIDFRFLGHSFLTRADGKPTCSPNLSKQRRKPNIFKTLSKKKRRCIWEANASKQRKAENAHLSCRRWKWQIRVRSRRGVAAWSSKRVGQSIFHGMHTKKEGIISVVLLTQDKMHIQRKTHSTDQEVANMLKAMHKCTTLLLLVNDVVSHLSCRNSSIFNLCLGEPFKREFYNHIIHFAQSLLFTCLEILVTKQQGNLLNHICR